jgi:hypothetical protein
MASKKKRLTQEHIDKFLKANLTGLLERTRETQPTAVADLIRLVEIERQLVPAKIVPRQVIWEDYLDASPDREVKREPLQ